jgi:nitrogen fixation/metabolism regulation signal transduction histidine kinase
VKTSQPAPIIGVWGLILIYVLLCILTILLSKTFFSGILQNGAVPDQVALMVFLTIPAVLLVFLSVSVLRLAQNMFASPSRTGRRFQIRLLGYFTLVALFAALPLVLITSQSITEVLRFWRNLDADAAMDYAQQFALDAYLLRMEKLENVVEATDLDSLLTASPEAFPENILAVQDFEKQDDEDFISVRYSGPADKRLETAPLVRPGFAVRELPRDIDVIRYIIMTDERNCRVVTYDLGEGFDEGIKGFENEKAKFETLKTLKVQIKPLMFLFYGVFFLPTVLMTLIIAISFTGSITKPLIELSEATRQVAEGDFSIHIMTRRNDELGLLVQSFNTMVRELEKSRSALVNAEKISIWQRMAAQLAHEIKNPLTPIKLSAERVLHRYRNAPERSGEILEASMLSIIQEVDGLSAMLTEFRTLSRPMEPSLSSTDVIELMEELIVAYRLSYPAIVFTIDHRESVVLVKVDRRRLSQILTNLIINAIDAVNGATADKRVEISASTVIKQEIRYGRISVRDTGNGISGEAAPHLFTPYFTTKESGTGLGLPIVERIVNDHGGSIWFNSAPGLGATFFVDLPSSR